MGRGIQRSMPRQQALTSREPSIALTNSQGIPDQLDSNPELYDGIMHMICVALEDNIHTDPEKSLLAKVGMKLAHPETHRWIRPQRIEVFVVGILRWLNMNSLLGPTSTSMQVGYLGTHLMGKAQEWFYCNVE